MAGRNWDIAANTLGIVAGKGVLRYEGKDVIKVTAPYDQRLMLKQIPGHCWDPISKVWQFPATARAMNSICNAGVNKGLSLAVAHDDETQRLLEAARDIERGQDIKNKEDLEDFASKTVGWMHQRQAFHFAKDFDGVGLFIDMGGGKSKVFVGLADHWEAQTILIACPKSVMGVWPKQFAIHSIRDYDFCVLDSSHTTAKKAQIAATFLLRPTRKPKVLISNYDITWRRQLLDVLKNAEFDLVGCDESHKIKAPGGKASKAMQAITKRSKRTVLMTGTPMPHGPEDVYAQARAADPDIFGTSFTRFRNKFFRMGGYENRIIKGFVTPDAEKDFNQKLGSFSYIITKDEMVKRMREMGFTMPDALPPVEVRGRMSPKADKVYNNLKREFVSELPPEGTVVTENALTRLLRLRQITGGFVTDDEGVLVELDDTKEKLLYDVLDGIDRSEPVVVFAAFHHDLDVIERVTEALGRTYAELSGRRRDALEADSTLAGGVDVAGVQLQSGGVGVDFTRSRYAVYYSVDYNLGNVLQSRARLDRPGQKYPVTFVHMIVETAAGKATVDDITYAALDERKDFVGAILDAARKGQM